jgi:transposase
MITQEEWMDLLSYRQMVAAGASWAEIARLAGCDWRTARKYLSPERKRPPRYKPRPPQPKLIDAYADLIDAELRASKAQVRATTICERLVAGHGYPGSYQRVKQYVRARRPEIAAELGIADRAAEMHRRFEVAAGAQAQVDWGHEKSLPDGSPVYSFHMVLSCSRDPFCLYTQSQDLTAFWACHTEAFTHFGGVPAEIVYDRTKTVVKRHVGRGEPVELHPEALAFAAHYGFTPRVCWPERPQSKGRVERVVPLTREKVGCGREHATLEDWQAAWWAWLPVRRAQVHRTHGEVIAVRAERDRAALGELPPQPYLVTERHLRVVGKDALVSFEASLYSVPWTLVLPRQRLELRVTPGEVAIWSLGAEPRLLATHPRARERGSWVVDERHWDGLPDGRGAHAGPAALLPEPLSGDGLADLLVRFAAAAVPVARRDIASYDEIFAVPAGGAR